jgi:hypothetical protein
VAPGYYGAAVLDDGVASAGETFGMTVTILNTGDSTAYGVRATLSTSDPYVIISQNFARYGAIPRNRAVVGIDTFLVQFKTNMPKDHADYPSVARPNNQMKNRELEHP